MSKEVSSKEERCWMCSKLGHYKNQCPEIICYYCGGHHMKKNCWKYQLNQLFKKRSIQNQFKIQTQSFQFLSKAKDENKKPKTKPKKKTAKEKRIRWLISMKAKKEAKKKNKESPWRKNKIKSEIQILDNIESKIDIRKNDQHKKENKLDIASVPSIKKEKNIFQDTTPDTTYYYYPSQQMLNPFMPFPPKNNFLDYANSQMKEEIMKNRDRFQYSINYRQGIEILHNVHKASKYLYKSTNSGENSKDKEKIEKAKSYLLNKENLFATLTLLQITPEYAKRETKYLELLPYELKF